MRLLVFGGCPIWNIFVVAGSTHIIITIVGIIIFTTTSASATGELWVVFVEVALGRREGGESAGGAQGLGERESHGQDSILNDGVDGGCHVNVFADDKVGG